MIRMPNDEFERNRGGMGKFQSVKWRDLGSDLEGPKTFFKNISKTVG